MQDIELAIKQEFLSEAQEMLESIEQSFLELEKTPNDSTIVDSIFRFVHTIKGSGYAAGFDGLAEFVHNFEAVLSRVRAQELELSDEIIDIFLQATDLTGKYIEILGEDFAATLDTQEVESRLQPFLGGPTAADLAAPAVDFSQGFALFDDDDDVAAATSAAAPTQAATPAAASAPAATPAQKTLAPVVSITNLASSPQVATAASPLLAPNGHKPRIVICDDEPDILDLIEMSLEGCGYELMKALNGKEALEIINNNQVDAILTDLKMPEMDGLKLLENLVASGTRAPVIFCSGFADRAELIAFIEHGAFGFIEKPFNAEQITATLNKALHYKFMEDAVQQLSVHNFSAYLTVNQMAKFAENGNKEKFQQAQAKMEVELEKISVLTNRILQPKIKLKKSA